MPRARKRAYTALMRKRDQSLGLCLQCGMAEKLTADQKRELSRLGQMWLATLKLSAAGEAH